MNNPHVFNRSALRPGMVAGRMSTAAISKGIVLRTAGAAALAQGRSWSHDGIFIQHNHRWYIGDAEMGHKAALTPIENWEAAALAGQCRVIVLWPHGATAAQGEAAAWWWQCNVQGSTYDSLAIKHLAWRWAAEKFGNKLGREDHFYCTEGVRDSWMMGASFDPWAPKVNPTPGTTWKRLRQGRFDEVVDGLTEAGAGVRVKV
jgi:hypothetical protein